MYRKPATPGSLLSQVQIVNLNKVVNIREISSKLIKSQQLTMRATIDVTNLGYEIVHNINVHVFTCKKFNCSTIINNTSILLTILNFVITLNTKKVLLVPKHELFLRNSYFRFKHGIDYFFEMKQKINCHTLNELFWRKQNFTV